MFVCMPDRRFVKTHQFLMVSPLTSSKIRKMGFPKVCVADELCVLLMRSRWLEVCVADELCVLLMRSRWLR
jgi:hypothetical protein